MLATRKLEQIGRLRPITRLRQAAADRVALIPTYLEQLFSSCFEVPHTLLFFLQLLQQRNIMRAEDSQCLEHEETVTPTLTNPHDLGVAQSLEWSVPWMLKSLVFRPYDPPLSGLIQSSVVTIIFEFIYFYYSNLQYIILTTPIHFQSGPCGLTANTPRRPAISSLASPRHSACSMR
jgi:hypothetical protein